MALNEDIIYKRLKQVRGAQESVESISSWILHHVKYVSSISRIWYDTYLSASDDLKISLVYVLNDVCQKSRKLPKDQNLKITSSFYYHLRYAIPFSSDKVKEKIRRVVGILKERQIFTIHKFEELNLILDGKLTMELPADKSVNEDIGQDLIKEAENIKKKYDKYYALMVKYLGEEGIYNSFKKTEEDNEEDYDIEVKRPRLSPTDFDSINELQASIEIDMKNVTHVVDPSSSSYNAFQANLSDEFLRTFRNTKDALDRCNQITIITERMQQVAAAEVAKEEGKTGLLNRKTLGLEFVMPVSNIKEVPEEEGIEYDSWKIIRSERIQQLKKKVDEDLKNGNNSSAKSTTEAVRKPSVSDASSPSKKSISFNESEEANQFLNSIPLPSEPTVTPIPSMPSIPPTKAFSISPPPALASQFSAMVYDDVAPPGVDLPPIQIPPHAPPVAYDPTSAYSPTDPSGYYSPMVYNPMHPQITSPSAFFRSPPPASPHVYNNNFGPRFPPNGSNSAYYDQGYYKH